MTHVIATDGADPEAQMAVDFLEGGSEVAEARGKAARIRNPDVVLIVILGVVEEEGM
jgi:hypothetical protein